MFWVFVSAIPTVVVTITCPGVGDTETIATGEVTFATHWHRGYGRITWGHQYKYYANYINYAKCIIIHLEEGQVGLFPSSWTLAR